MIPAECMPVLVETTPARTAGFEVRTVHWVRSYPEVDANGQLAFRVGAAHELVRAPRDEEVKA